MRYYLTMLIAGVMLLSAGVARAADPYAIDPAHSSIGFAVRHLAISHVHGEFADFQGQIFYDEQDIAHSSVMVTINAASINTRNAKRDAHLRSADFFDADKFPQITFTSARITPQGDGYVCTGTLAMHGVSKEISIPFTLTGKIQDPWGKTRVGVEAELMLDRQDFGISWNKALEGGGVMVGNAVQVALNIEAVKQ